MSPAAQKTLYWLRWIAVVPVFLLVFKIGPWIAYELLLPCHGDPVARAQAFLILSTLLTSFLQPLFCTAIAPRGVLLVSAISAFFAALPAVFLMVMGSMMKGEIAGLNGVKNSGDADFVAVRHLAFSSFAGAGLALMLIWLVWRWRRARIARA